MANNYDSYACLKQNEITTVLVFNFNWCTLYVGPCKSGEFALGMENGRIGNSQITASSTWSTSLSTKQARLNGFSSWSARQQDTNQWVQIDLGKEEAVAAIATQGRRNAKEWVKTYSVSYSSDGVNFHYYKINGIVMVSSMDVCTASADMVLIPNVFCLEYLKKPQTSSPYSRNFYDWYYFPLDCWTIFWKGPGLPDYTNTVAQTVISAVKKPRQIQRKKMRIVKSLAYFIRVIQHPRRNTLRT